jgi:hypothetical protein
MSAETLILFWLLADAIATAWDVERLLRGKGRAHGLVDPNTDPMDESAYCDWLEKARALVSPEAAEEGRK